MQVSVESGADRERFPQPFDGRSDFPLSQAIPNLRSDRGSRRSEHSLRKYDGVVEFASTPGGSCAYHLDLFAIPIVATINYSTKNRELLNTHDWLGNAGNRVLVERATFVQPEQEQGAHR